MRTFFSIVIPAFNEEARICTAIQEVRTLFNVLGFSYEIIVVDDGSTDDTAVIVRSLANEYSQIHLFHHDTNRGKGSAVRSGVMEAKGDWILLLDADLSAHPREMIALISRLESCDMIIGSRRARGTRIEKAQPFYRVFFGRLFNFFGVRLYLGLPFYDTQCGFKLFRKDIAPICSQLQTAGWVFDVELIARVFIKGFRIVEVPVTWSHGRESKVHLRHVFSILSELKTIQKILRKQEDP
ncbi:MAG: glycosyltransferase family 2 protein [bacterium]|nr:glycosyltransferase family 2 protein [bacterium]